MIGFASLMLAAGCGGDDGGGAEDDGGSAPAECGNGVMEAGEQCDGTDFGGASCATSGWEAGEFACDASCTIDVTACVVLDQDLDGLDIYQETEIGTDPLNPDSDFDGQPDGFEVQNGSDPLNHYSWPQNMGAWPNRLGPAAEAGLGANQDVLGLDVGDTFWNYYWTDQFGIDVELYQLYGYVVVLSAGARWCPPCQEAASTSQALWDEYRDQGVIFLEVLVDGLTPGVDATPNDLSAWVNQYDLHYPVVMKREGFLPASALPTYWYLDRNMVVRHTTQGFGGDAAVRQQIDAILAEQP